jgi:hypothetical protein
MMMRMSSLGTRRLALARLARPIVSMLLLALPACGSNVVPAASSAALPTAPSAQPAPSVAALQILDVPTSLPLGRTAQLRAVGTYPDGTYVDVSAKATWQSSNPAVCAVSPTGLVSATGAGTATIEARQDSLSRSASVACGFVVIATVHENAPTTNVVLPGTQVVVVGGPHAGLTVSTDAQGRVALPPVSGPGFRLQFKKVGYDDTDYIVEQLPREADLDITMLREPSVRVEYQSACPSSVGSLTTHREGRLRLSVSIPGALRFDFASLWVVSPDADPAHRRLWARAEAFGGSQLTDVVDALLPAGQYRVETYCSTTDNQFKLTVEHLP